MLICPNNQWSTQRFHQEVKDACHFEVARQLVNGKEASAINKAEVEATFLKSWLETAIPAGTA
jgi:hypothetical protein